MIESILIATDGSDAAHVAERFGVAVAARLRTRCYGLTVIEERVTLGLRADSLGIPPGPLDGVENFLKVRADAACRRLADTSRAQGIDCAPEAVRGVADDRIVERAQGADLVVLGRDGDHAAGRSVLIGSTVDGVLRKTSKSAVVVPMGAEFGGPIVLAFDGSPGSRVAAKIAVELDRPPRAAALRVRRFEGQGTRHRALRRGETPARHALGARARELLHAGPPGREDRGRGAQRARGADRARRLWAQPHQRVLPREQRSGRRAHLARGRAVGALTL